MAENNNLLKEKAQIIANLKKMQEEIGKNEARQTDEYMTQQKRLKEILTELKRIKSETEASLGVTESFASSLGGIYRKLDDNLSSQKTLVDGLQSKFVEIESSAGGFNDANLKAREQIGNILTGYSLLEELQNQISQLTYEDVEQRQLLNQQIADAQQLIQEEVNQLDKRTTLGKEFMSIQTQLNSKAEQRTEEAKKLGALTEKEKEVLENQLRVFDSITSKVNALEESLLTFIRRPQAAVGGLLVAFGSVVNKIGDVNKQLGTTLFQSDGVGRKAGVLSFIFEDAAGTAKNLSSELGSTDRATFGLQTNVGLMAMNMGISNSEATSLVGSFTRLNGNSTDIATDMVATSREFAKQNGIIPSQLMGDLANSAEEFALFGKQGGKNIVEAAGFAAKLGVNMKTISGISENLLDFESSITKELELGAMLGRNINLNKARELAFNNDLEGAAKETLKAIGGQAAFERMNHFQRKQTAELLGVSVAELQKMVANEEQAATTVGMINSEFSKVGEFINGGLNEYLGTSLQALGGMVASGAEFGANISMAGEGIGKLSGLFKKVGGATETVTNTVETITDVKDIASTASNVGDAAGAVKGAGIGLQLTSLAQGLKMMGSPKVLFGALNLIPTGIGFIGLLPGIPGMIATSLLGVSTGTGLSALAVGLTQMSRTLPGAAALALTGIGFGLFTLGLPGMIAVSLFGGIASAGLTALSVGLTTFGTAAANPLFQSGIVALFALGIALLPLSASLAIAAPAISSFGDVIKGAFDGLASIITATSEGLVSMLGVITLEKAGAMIALGAAFPLLALGIGSLAIAATLGGGKVTSFIQGIAESASLLGGGAAQGLQTTAQALMSMGSGLSVINEQLDRLNPEKLDALSNFSMSLSIGGAVTAIGDAVGGLVDSVSAVIGGGNDEEGSLSQYETDALRYLERIAVATEKGATIKGRDRSAFNPIGISNN